MKVLVVDDNRDAADSLTLLVALMGHAVRTVYDGAQALSVAASFVPDLVLLDLGMPGMDGYEVCRRLRSEPWGASATIVAVTGWGREEDRALTSAAGFSAHWVKPVAPENISEILSRPT